MRRFGAESLSDYELLAILLGTGTKGASALHLAQQVLLAAQRSGWGLRYLSWASLEELQTIPGIGAAKAAQIKAALELGKRVAEPEAPEHRIREAADVWLLMRERACGADREQFWVISLDVRGGVRGIDLVSVGTVDSSLVHPREVFRGAIGRRATSVVVVHNHPSGNPSPSPQDWELTRRLVEAGQILGVRVLDHVIVTYDSFFSLRAHAGDKIWEEQVFAGDGKE